MTTTWSGESPTSSCALTWAPLSNSSLAIVTCLLSTASKRGVCWRLLRRSTSDWGRACNQDAWVIDQAWMVRSTEFLSELQSRQTRTRPISSHLDLTILVNNDLSYCLWGNFCRGTQWVVPNKQDSAILPPWVANHSTIISPAQEAGSKIRQGSIWVKLGKGVGERSVVSPSQTKFPTTVSH